MGHASRHFSESCSRTAVSLSFSHIPSVPLSHFFSRVQTYTSAQKDSNLVADAFFGEPTLYMVIGI